MKSFHTYLLAMSLGIVAVVLWLANTDENDATTTPMKKSDWSMGEGIDSIDESGSREATGSRRGSLPSSKRTDHQSSLVDQMKKKITLADLEAWLASKEGDPHAFGEALVIAGLLTGDPDLIRRGIESDPKNPHLLFLAATMPSLSAEERLAMSKRLFEADPQNGLAAFSHASQLFQSGQSEAAIQLLKSSGELTRIDDFRNSTQLLMEEAYTAAGLSPLSAKGLSVFNLPSSGYSDLLDLTRSLKGMEGSLSSEEASQLRSLTASMGMLLADESRPRSMIDQLVGIRLEEETLKGLPGDAPSPYNGLTVGQARESIAEQRKALKQAMQSGIDSVETIFSTHPELASGYFDRVLVTGELEAIQWLRSESEKVK